MRERAIRRSCFDGAVDGLKELIVINRESHPKKLE